MQLNESCTRSCWVLGERDWYCLDCFEIFVIGILLLLMMRHVPSTNKNCYHQTTCSSDLKLNARTRNRCCIHSLSCSLILEHSAHT